MLAAKILAEGDVKRNTGFADFVRNVYTPYVHQHNTNIYVKEIFICYMFSPLQC